MQIPQSDPEEPLKAGRGLRPGQNVRVRGARWRVVDVHPHGTCRIVTLAGLAPPQLGVERRVIEPFDSIDPVDRRRDPRVVSAERWRRACRALIASDTPAASLVAARSARIELMPHQLEPAMAIVAGIGTRMLLADEVGLGKTIEAALIVAELRMRGWIDRVLVLTPAGLREQWRQELHDRFDLDATIVGAHALRGLAATLPIGVNPWTTVTTAIASIDYVKRAEVLPAIAACRWDVVIVDEAHSVVGDSDRHEAVRALGARAPFVLLLTATPHSGDERSFTALRDVGSAGRDPLVVFRRTRAEVRIRAHRRVHTLRVRPTRSERDMHAALARYGDAVRAERSSAWLALSVLHKRAFSSAWALLRSVERRLAALAGTTSVDGEQMALPLGDPSGEFLTADEAPEWPAGLALGDPTRERRLLTALAEACRSVGSSESKMGSLVRLLRRAHESAIVFTEYRDTLLHLQRMLAGLPVAVLHGGLNPHERTAALAAFSRGARMILLATDAAGEGLNLHGACRLVVNLELPWNPMRLEQRIGRVDRIGQRRTVHAVHLVARGTGETAVLDRLKARIARAQSALGAPDPLGADETRIARFVVTRDREPEADSDRAGAANATSESGAARDAVVAPNLGAAAAVEADRLRVARAWSRKHDAAMLAALDGDGPWLVTASHRVRLRAALGAKSLLIWRVALENPSGRILASRLVPMTIDGIPRVRTHAAMKRLVRDAAECLASHVDRASRDWRDVADAAVRAFLETRLSREREIARVSRTVPFTFQPGLFDRRAERTHDALLDRQVESQRDAVERIAALEHTATVWRGSWQLVLAVVP
jgi:superfamily II DNA or RNA helicase